MNTAVNSEGGLTVGDVWVGDGKIMKVLRIFTSTVVVQTYHGVTGKSAQRPESVNKAKFLQAIRGRAYKPYAGEPVLVEYLSSDQKAKMKKIFGITKKSTVVKPKKSAL